MIQFYSDLKNQVKEIKDKNLSGGQIQKIYSTAFYISMGIRTPGKTWWLYIGRGGGYEGLWIDDSPPPSEIRRKDTFLEYLRRHISSCGFLGVSLDQADRIIRIDYQKYGSRQSLLMFWKARQTYFLHYYQEEFQKEYKLLLSWMGKSIKPSFDMDDLNSYFDQVGRRNDFKHELKSSEFKNIKELIKEELNQGSNQPSVLKKNFINRKEENIRNDLRKAEQWKILEEYLKQKREIVGHEIKIGDQKIKFPSSSNEYEKRNAIFEKIKKLKRGENILKERLNQVEALKIEDKAKKIEKSELPIVRPIWSRIESKKTYDSDTKKEYVVISVNGIQMGVGTSAFGNDQLRNKWSGKEDIWLHLDGHKSSHLILKLPDNNTLDTVIINIAASILADFSRFNGDWIPIIYTQIKNLKGVTGSPGMVTYKKEKHLNCPRVDVSTWLKEEK
jgi:predicted ribosome quality control (RQC) complex YloA/Tae2 family protein